MGFFKMYLILKPESKEFKIYLQQQHINKNTTT